MLAQSSCQLLKELKRSHSSKLPSYNEELIRTSLEEMKTLYDSNLADVNAISAASSSSESSSPPVDHGGRIQCVVVRHAILERNKRCLLAYHHSRLMSVKNLRWELGAILPRAIRQSLSEAEQNWFKNYCTALADYMHSTDASPGGGCLDLTLMNIPPKSFLVEVRCLEDFGEYETEDGGVINLTKDSYHLMPRRDCEPLIRQGVLEHLGGS